MNRPNSLRSPARRHRRFIVEPLEVRCLLSDGLSVIATSPLDGQQIAGALDTITVSFDQQDAFLASNWSYTCLQVYSLDGSTPTPVSDPLSTVVGFTDDNFQTESLTFSPPLGPGKYELDFQPDPSSSSLTKLADFTVVSTALGATFGTAYDLGTIGAHVRAQSGALDPPGGMNDYTLYKIHLEQGPALWRLGLQLDPTGTDPAFGVALALFDSSGTVLSTCNAGAGMPGSPNSPYLFAGLSPGDYYVGVSGAGNLPGQVGGYDPTTGFAGWIGTNLDGGSYHLQLVAQPATRTAVVGFTLNWTDTLDPSPTGLTLAFSGPIDPRSILGDGNGFSPVVAVSGSKTYSLTPSGYDLTRNQLSFVFDQKLPPGPYTLRLPAQRGLTDLVGQPPVAPTLPPGTLASWTVAQRTIPPSTNDLGALYPGQTDGDSRSTTVTPANPAVFRVVVPVAGFYSLKTTVNEANLAITQTGRNGLTALDFRAASDLNGLDLYLTEGVYLFTLRTPSASPVSVRVELRPKSVDAESLINNGIGQTAALDLRLVSSTGGLTPGAPPALATVETANLAPDPAPAGASGQSIVSSTQAIGLGTPSTAVPATSIPSPVPASLLVSVNTGLLGNPASQSAHLAVVGPTVPGGSVVLADSSSRLLPGITYTSSGESEPAAASPTEVIVVSGTSPAAGNPDRPPTPEPPSATSLAALGDATALEKADSIVAMVSNVSRWLFDAQGGSEPLPGLEQGAEQTVVAGLERGASDPRVELRSDQIERAGFGVPLGIVVASAAAYRLRQLAGRWWRRGCTVPRSFDAGHGNPYGAGPRCLRRTGETTWVRSPKRR
jgi:hypothetical protein